MDLDMIAFLTPCVAVVTLGFCVARWWVMDRAMRRIRPLQRAQPRPDGGWELPAPLPAAELHQLIRDTALSARLGRLQWMGLVITFVGEVINVARSLS